MHVTKPCSNPSVETLPEVDCFKCDGGSEPEFKVESVSISPESGDYEISDGGSLVYSLAWVGNGASYCEIDLNIDAPAGDLDSRYQFTLTADENNPCGDDCSGLDAQGISVSYVSDSLGGAWSIDFGADISSELVDSGKVEIYAALKDQDKNNLWGDMSNPSSDQRVTINVIRQ